MLVESVVCRAANLGLFCSTESSIGGSIMKEVVVLMLMISVRLMDKHGLSGAGQSPAAYPSRAALSVPVPELKHFGFT